MRWLGSVPLGFALQCLAELFADVSGFGDGGSQPSFELTKEVILSKAALLPLKAIQFDLSNTPKECEEPFASRVISKYGLEGVKVPQR